MTPRSSLPQLPLTIFLVSLLAGFAACRPAPESFYGKLYGCNPGEGSAACGTNQQGEPMACFAGHQLGARDTCMDACTGSSAESSSSICLDSQVRLATCRPSEDVATSPAHVACGGRPLSCLRTDLVKDEGVCVAMSVCREDTDCRDPDRRVCAGSLVRAMFGPVPVATDHLYCLSVGCAAGGTQCPTGESCLPKTIPNESNAPDICVPNCDAQLNCPPNHFCLRRVSGPGSAAVCIPGLPGFRCTRDIDCLVGDCVDTGEGFKLCSLPCRNDDDCAALQTARDLLYCKLKGKEGRQYCLRVAAFDGSFCNRDADCQPGEACVKPGPTQSPVCLPRCAPGDACRDRGGFPTSCQQHLSPPVCYPGKFGAACEPEKGCVAPLVCSEVRASEPGAAPERRRVCTTPCKTDPDCSGLIYEAGGFCQEGSCAPVRAIGDLCERDSQCSSQICLPSQREGEVGTKLRRCAKERL